MISFFSVMIYVTSIIAIVVTLVFYAGILMSNKNISSGRVYFLQCTVENLQSFKRGVCFGLLVLCIWFIQKGMP